MDTNRKENLLAAPEPLLLSRREVDELYELLEVLFEAFESLNIPYILIGGSLLGAIRSKSILFNDDDIDIAIIDDRLSSNHEWDDTNDDGTVYDRLKQYLPDLLNQSADQRNMKQQYDVTFTHKKTTHVTYMYQIRPWIGCDRVRSSADPRVWIDIFVLKKYDTLDSLKEIISIKQNGEAQTADYVENILTTMRSTNSSSRLDDIFPLYHYDNRKAIELWPKEFFLSIELFPLHKSLSFGPLNKVSGPCIPIRALRRWFGDDCFTHYYKADAHVRGKKQRKDEYLSWDQCVKLPLTDEMYMPLQHSKRNGACTVHTREILMEYLDSQETVELSSFEHNTLSSVDLLPSHIRRNHTDIELGHPSIHSEITRSRTFVANQELKEQMKWFGSAIRRHMNDSPDLPIFDQALRDIMGRYCATSSIWILLNIVFLALMSFISNSINRTPHCKSS